MLQPLEAAPRRPSGQLRLVALAVLRPEFEAAVAADPSQRGGVSLRLPGVIHRRSPPAASVSIRSNIAVVGTHNFRRRRRSLLETSRRPRGACQAVASLADDECHLVTSNLDAVSGDAAIQPQDPGQSVQRRRGGIARGGRIVSRRGWGSHDRAGRGRRRFAGGSPSGNSPRS